jgi:hypothetical protein
MAHTTYNNLPFETVLNSNSTVQSFDSYYNKPIELSTGVFNAVTAFFTKRGFDPQAAQSIAVIVIQQAKKDNYNPMTILDTISGYDSAQISALVTEILNYNRYKSSFLGYALAFVINPEVARNILA